MQIPTSIHALSAVLVLGASGAPASAQRPPARPAAYAIRSVRLSDDPAEEPHTLVLRHGRIAAILESGVDLPPGLLAIDGEGLLALPGLVDAYSTAGCETPEPTTDRDLPTDVAASVDLAMRQANRHGIQPAFRAIEVFDGAAPAEAYRERGFGAWLAAPEGEILSGSSVLVTTRGAPTRDVVLREPVFAHAAFAASGGGYPRTLMGFHAQLRQFLADAKHQTELAERRAAGRPGPRPVWDADLDAAAPLLTGERRLVCEAQTAGDIERWMRLADELGLRIAIAGGREAWKLSRELAEREIPVLLTLDWGDEVDDPDDPKAGKSGKSGKRKKGRSPEEEVEPEGADPAARVDEDADVDEAPPAEVAGGDEDDGDWIYEEPLGVRRERRRLWVEARDGALRLHEAGVTLAFCSGSASPKELLERVRTVVEHGFPPEDALAALTTTPARMLGIEDRIGRIEVGADATLALWTEAPTEKKARVAEAFVDGFRYEQEKAPDAAGPDEGVDASGRWRIVTDGDEDAAAFAELVMEEDGTLSGTIDVPSPNGGGRAEFPVEGRVSGTEITLEGTLTLGDVEIHGELEGELEGDSIEGRSTVETPDGSATRPFVATRSPERDQRRTR